MFDEYDSVETTEALEPDIPAGTRGAIVMVYPSEPAEYEVEFVDGDGRTLAVRTVEEWKLRRADGAD